MIYAIDLDDTLCEGIWPEPYEGAIPIRNAIDKVNILYDKGEAVVIYSARFEEDREVTAKWLSEHGVKYHRLILGKFRADMYIDTHSKRIEEI